MSQMRIHARALLPALALTFAFGCKKDPPITVDPDEATTGEEPGDEAGEETPAEPELPPQDPDPGALAENAARLQLGHFEEVIAALQPLVESWTEDTQIANRARGLALITLAHSHGIVDNGDAPSDEAMKLAERLGDEAVSNDAALARAAYLVGIGEAAEGEALARAVVDGGDASADAFKILAEALIGQAFDENDRLSDKAKMEEAAGVYDKMLAAAQSDIEKAHAQTGLAAVAKYLGDKETSCTRAKEATASLEAAGEVHEYVREVPDILIKENRCKK